MRIVLKNIGCNILPERWIDRLDSESKIHVKGG
jgi:hypothetical protein